MNFKTGDVVTLNIMGTWIVGKLLQHNPDGSILLERPYIVAPNSLFNWDYPVAPQSNTTYLFTKEFIVAGPLVPKQEVVNAYLQSVSNIVVPKAQPPQPPPISGRGSGGVPPTRRGGGLM